MGLLGLGEIPGHGNSRIDHKITMHLGKIGMYTLFVDKPKWQNSSSS
jgi:hypothetical protein